MREDLTVILANGSFPTAPLPLEILQSAVRVICCDGAAGTLLDYGRTPDIIIGDLDSLPCELAARLKDRVIHISEQESNDLTKAFNYCLSAGWNNIAILGATGKREDHTLGNVSLLADFSVQVPTVKMYTDEGVFSVIRRSSVISSVKGQQISLFSLKQGTAITSTGLKYPLNELKPDIWWQATLNEALGDEFSLSFQGEAPILVFKVY